MKRLLQSPLVIILLGGILFFATMFGILHTTPLGDGSVAEHPAIKPEDDPSWKFKNPELEQWVAQLKEERAALALREQQLTEWEARLAAERKELSGVTITVSNLQTEFDQRVLLFRDAEKENIKKQTKVISGMSPDGAAAMLNEMTDSEATKLLFSMKPDACGAILDAMSKLGQLQAKRAAGLAQRLKDILPMATNPTNNHVRS